MGAQFFRIMLLYLERLSFYWGQKVPPCKRGESIIPGGILSRSLVVNSGEARPHLGDSPEIFFPFTQGVLAGSKGYENIGARRSGEKTLGARG